MKNAVDIIFTTEKMYNFLPSYMLTKILNSYFILYRKLA